MFIFVISFLFSPWLTQGDSQNESSCVKCHTDASMMKSLFKPPKVDLGEGEG